MFFPIQLPKKTDVPSNFKPIESFLATSELQDDDDFVVNKNNEDLNDDLDPIEED